MTSSTPKTGSYLPSLADWQANLLGNDEAGAHLARQVAKATSQDHAKTITKAFMEAAFSGLRSNLRNLKNTEGLLLQKTLLSCEKVLQDDLSISKPPYVMTEDDNLQAQKMRPTHFMSVYEAYPAMATSDWVSFQMLGELARGHEQAALATALYLNRLQRVETASRPGENYEERALSARLVSFKRNLADHPAISDSGQCLETCQILADHYKPEHGTIGIVRQARTILNKVFADYETAKAACEDVAYPNPFGLDLTAELKAEDRTTGEILKDFFKPERLVEERRVRMKSVLMRTPDLMETICRIVQVVHAMRETDAENTTTVQACERVAERIAALKEREQRFEALAKEDALVVEKRMLSLDESLRNRVDGMAPSAPIPPAMPRKRVKPSGFKP